MNDGIGLAEVVLGPPGFRVLDVVESDVKVVISIESTAARAFCRTCGARAEPQDRMRVNLSARSAALQFVAVPDRECAGVRANLWFERWVVRRR